MRISDWSSDVCSSDLPPFSGERRLSGRTDEALFLERYSDRQFYLVRHERHIFAYAEITALDRRDAGKADIELLVHRLRSRTGELRIQGDGLGNAVQGQIASDFGSGAVDLHCGGNEFGGRILIDIRSEEHTSELQALMRISYCV